MNCNELQKLEQRHDYMWWENEPGGIIIKRDFKNAPTDNSIILVCVLRDEELLLPYFIDYYKKMGVSHFVFVDNGSIDNSQKYLTEHEFENIKVYHTKDSYADNLYGVAWVNQILNEQLKNKWCIVVDVDELLMLKENMKLPEVREKMIKNDSSILVTCLIDFYPRTLNERKYIPNTSFFEHSNYYDELDDNNIFWEIQNDDIPTIKGGLRHRLHGESNVANNDSVCLTKKTFFKYDFYETHRLSEGTHWITPNEFIDWMNPNNDKLWKSTNKFLKFYNDIFILAHFKYLKPNIFEYFKKRIINGEDWAGPGINGNRGKGQSQEYKSYIENSVNTFYDENISKKFFSMEKLYTKTVDKLIDFKNIENKKIILIISAQRHATTTLCNKLSKLDNSVCLYEAFNKEHGIFYSEQCANLRSHLLRKIVGKSWIRDKTIISFKIFKDHCVDLRELFETNLINKVIFLRRDLGDSYTSFRTAHETGDWKTNPNMRSHKTGYKLDTSKIPSVEKYAHELKAWFGSTYDLVNEFEIPMERIYFHDVIDENFDVNKLL